MSSIKKLILEWWPEIVALLTISLLSYAIDISHASYYRDDWYYIYDGYVAGPKIYHTMFASDRPARGVFFEIYYFFFGPHALPYHLLAYLWRLLSGIGALWLFHILWPKKRSENLIAAILCLTYPGYLWWVAGVEYQPMIASFCLHIFSIGLTLKVLSIQNRTKKFILIIISILTGLSALFLVDYAIGMEIFRVICIFLLVSKTQRAKHLPHKLILTVQESLIPLIIPLSFSLWKIFLFKGDRQATSITFQLNVFLNSPIQTCLQWSKSFLESVLNVTFLAWGMPLKNYFSTLSNSELIYNSFIGIAAVGIFLYALFSIKDKTFIKTSKFEVSWQREMIGLGVAGIVFGILPIIIANRHVAFQAYSHYALPASLAVAIFVTGVIHSFKHKVIHLILVAILIWSSVLTHRVISTIAIREQQTIRNFWWQVYWRISSFDNGTSIAVIYPSLYYGEDTDIAWGPGNLMYYPKQDLGINTVHYKLGAIPLTAEGITNVIGNDLRKTDTYRSHTIFLNYRQVVVISQPAFASCVHVIDPKWQEFSIYDSAEHMKIFPYSRIGNVINDGDPPTPLKFAFGIEPLHNWCYYYEKASRAQQQGDWETIARLAEDVKKAQLEPGDLIELLPFLRAYTYLGDQDNIKAISTKFHGNQFYMSQACKIPLQMKENGYSIQTEITRVVENVFCNP